MKCKWCGKAITKERRTVYCCKECYQMARREESRKPKKEDVNSGAILKKKEVCKGCKPLCGGQTDLKNTCNYSDNEKRSRIVIERANGGVKSDSCCCYERK